MGPVAQGNGSYVPSLVPKQVSPICAAYLADQEGPGAIGRDPDSQPPYLRVGYYEPARCRRFNGLQVAVG
jgi:hypothetical protein